MSSGYNIRWANRTQAELQSAYDYLHNHWGVPSMQKLSRQINQVITMIEDNPRIFPYSDKSGIHRAVVNKHYIITYQIEEKTKNIYILTFFNAHQNPNKL